MGKYDNKRQYKIFILASKKHTQINFKVKIQVLEGVVFQTKVLFSRKCIRNFSCRIYIYMALKKNYPPMAIFSA